MNLIEILYQPYVIILFICLVITISVYFYMKYSKVEEEENNHTNLEQAKTLLITFIVSFVLLMLSYFGVLYAGKNNLFERIKIDQSGGGFENDFLDRLTVMSEDVDFDLMED